MSMPALFKGRLSIPVIGSPLFIISVPDLVIAQCKAGVVGSFPALNARPASLLDELTALSLPPTGVGFEETRRVLDIDRSEFERARGHGFEKGELVNNYILTLATAETSTRIGRRFLAWNSGSFFLRSASVGLPSPVHTKASSARRATRSGCCCAKSAALSAPELMP